MRLIREFSQEETSESMNEFIELLSQYQRHANYRGARSSEASEGVIDKNFLLQRFSKIFAKFSLNDDFNNFLPLQSKGISLLTEVEIKNPQLHSEITKLLYNNDQGVNTSENENKILELLDRYPDWKSKFLPFLTQDNREEAKEPKENNATKTVQQLPELQNASNNIIPKKSN